LIASIVVASSYGGLNDVPLIFSSVNIQLAAAVQGHEMQPPMEAIMADLLAQFLGLLALLGLVAWGYRRWVKPRDADLRGKGMLLLIVMTLVGGLLGSTGWWIDDPRSFSWDLPPLASRMLASAAWAFGVASFAALERPVPHRTRLVLIMLATYLAPLLVAIVLFHLDRFDLSAPITYAFFTIVLLMTILAVWYLLRLPLIIPDTSTDSLSSSPLVRVWLGFVAAVTALWSLALFVTDDGPSKLIWVWPGDLLTSRLIAVMLLTLAVGVVYSLRHADVSRLMLGVIAVYGFGVALANLWNALARLPVNFSYVAAFGTMFLVSTILYC
jgi:hypothetical protein